VASRSTFNVGMLQNTWRPRESSDGRTASPRTSFPNAGATRPAATCLDGLSQDGRLILPLTTNRGFIRNDPSVSIERRGRFPGSSAGHPSFCRGGFLRSRSAVVKVLADPLSEAALADAFEKGGWKEVTGPCRSNNVPEDRCWLRAPGWGLTREFRPSSTTLEALAPGPPRE
jgi:protein-L-isoaspartate(D-aspartate) O-methyltransferase